MKRTASGFSLIELVVALVVAAIVAAFSVGLLAAPPATMQAVERRAALADAAQRSIAQLGGDLRQALPNSVRLRSSGGVVAIEHLAVLDSAALFPDDPGVGSDQALLVGKPDDRFETLGSFSAIAQPFASDRAYLVVADDRTSAANAYALSDVISPPGTRIDISRGSAAGQDLVTLSPAVGFSAIGTRRRVYLVSGAVTYLCDSRAGTLRRYRGYRVLPDQRSVDSEAELIAAGATRENIADSVSACRMTLTRPARGTQSVIDLAIAFTRDGETIRGLSRMVTDDGA